MVQKENPSIRTIFTLLSSMIGGAMLTFPILFKTAGIVTGVIVLIVSSFISYKTCRIYVMHLAPSDTDIEDTIRRILGLKWEKFFRLITGFYLVLLNIIYIVLIVDQTYNIIYFIMLKADAKNYIADKKVDHFVFDRFSKQYLSLIMYLPILAATFIKNLSFVIKLASFGIISCFIYSLFLIYQFSATAVHGIDFSQINWVNTNIGELAGTSAIAFTVHTVVTTIVKSNKKQQNNLRDLKISYFLGLVIYSAIGIFGYLAIWNKNDCKETILNCYLDDWTSVFVQVGYFYGLSTIYPCFIEVGRERLLKYFYPTIEKNHLRNFNIIFVTAAVLMCFLGPYISLNTIMDLVGAVICFFFIYYIPTMLHMRCFYPLESDLNKSLISSSSKQSQTGQDLITSTITQQNQTTTDSQCCHDKNQKDKCPEKIRKGGYIFLNLIGVFIGIYGIYLVFA